MHLVSGQPRSGKLLVISSLRRTRTIRVTPMKAPSMEWAEVKRICIDCTVHGLETMSELRSANPFRFLYMSGLDAERDQTKKPHFMPEYFLMRARSTAD